MALATSNKFAEIIRPGVQKRLGLVPDGGGYPSVSSIKANIGRLKKAKA
jgi:hypothetical protein